MIKTIIERWKELNIQYADFEFNCGGDSMGDTNLTFTNKDNDLVEDSELSGYFEDEVYKNVEFYVNSDGHYQGESGNVRIELDDEEEYFDYFKSSLSEYCENFAETKECEITKEELDFINEYVSDIGKTNWSNETNFDFKKDFILTDEHNKLIQSITNKFDDCAEEWYEDVDDEAGDEYASYELSISDMEVREDNDKIFITLPLSCNITVYKEE